MLNQRSELSNVQSAWCCWRQSADCTAANSDLLGRGKNYQ